MIRVASELSGYTVKWKFLHGRPGSRRCEVGEQGWGRIDRVALVPAGKRAGSRSRLKNRLGIDILGFPR